MASGTLASHAADDAATRGQFTIKGSVTAGIAYRTTSQDTDLLANVNSSLDNPGHISRAGDAGVCSALYVAAHSLLTRNAQWSTLKAWGVRLAKTHGHRRAVIAVARKLAVILHRMWIDGSEFRWEAQPRPSHEPINRKV